ncbi:hypothetical protein [Enterobacter pasteurii]
MIIRNEEKAIWRCTIQSDTGWSPPEPLTLLRLAPAMVWTQPEQHPACFAGKITAAGSGFGPALTGNGKRIPPLSQTVQENTPAEVSTAENNSAHFGENIPMNNP